MEFMDIIKSYSLGGDTHESNKKFKTFEVRNLIDDLTRLIIQIDDKHDDPTLRSVFDIVIKDLVDIDNKMSAK